MARKTKEERAAEKAIKDLEAFEQKQREDAEKIKDFYPRLLAALETSYSLGWRIKFKDGYLFADEDSEWEIDYKNPAQDWALSVVEGEIKAELDRKAEEERRQQIREKVWEKLTEEEREALGMRKN